MQTTEVTVDQWRAVMGRRLLARKKGSGDMPVTKVSWHDCKKFIRKLNQMTGEQYLLPTEAQWEYAARAGSSTAYFWGNTIDCTRAMYANNPMKYDDCVSDNRSSGLDANWPAPVKRYPPNAWGLYDMHGNVWEWCEDFFDTYDSFSVVDPRETDSGQGPGASRRQLVRARIFMPQCQPGLWPPDEPLAEHRLPTDHGMCRTSREKRHSPSKATTSKITIIDGSVKSRIFLFFVIPACAGMTRFAAY
jgi:hypothetical protein